MTVTEALVRAVLEEPEMMVELLKLVAARTDEARAKKPAGRGRPEPGVLQIQFAWVDKEGRHHDFTWRRPLGAW